MLALSHLDVAGETRHALHGYFVRAPIDDLRSGLVTGCTLAEEAGACWRLECSGAEIDQTDDAGALRASGTTTVSAAASTEIGQYSSTGDGAVFEPGDVVTFEGTGGAVPAFTADVVAPDAPVVSVPTTVTRASRCRRARSTPPR